MARRTDEEIFLDCVPESGIGVGNIRLIDQLDWEERKYWAVRERLLDKGLIERGKGKGGSVRRTLHESEALALKPLRNSPEAGLYEPLLRVLKKEWAREMRIESDQIHFEITARQGKKPTGGTWTRPDITAVSVRSFQHLPGKYFDVWTFEVKSMEALDVTAVFEAASHASRATRSYALVQVPDVSGPEETELVDRCVREAARLRVGLIVFTDAATFGTWETKVEAPRLDTAPEALDEFIGYLSEDAKSRIARWK